MNMMTAEQLKVSILQLAIEGRLVEHLSEEGTGKDVLREISTERQYLFKAGKIKREVLPSIEENEKQFDLPETWGQTRLGDLVSKDIKRGKSPKYVDLSNILVFAQKCNVKKGGIDLGLAKYLDPDKFRSYPEEECMIDRDIVVNSTGNGTLGRIGIFRDGDNPRKLKVVPDSHVTVIRVCHAMSVDYIYYFLKANQLFLEKLGEGSTNQTELRPDILKMLVVPIPPLREQYRIVKKIEELMPFVDQYATVSEKLDKLNSEFPDQIKKSILQLAVEGKLVEQRPEEGTGEELYWKIQEEKAKLIKEGKIKKQKPLAEIADDEKPFDIPESWAWVRMNDCTDVRDGTHNSPKYHSEGIPLVTSKNLRNGKIDFSTCKLISMEDHNMIDLRSKVDNDDILFAMIGTVGNPVLYRGKEEFSIKNMALFKHIESYMNMEYVYWYLLLAQYNMQRQASGGVQNFVSLNYLRSYPIPIPPRDEQDRIVLKLNDAFKKLKMLTGYICK